MISCNKCLNEFSEADTRNVGNCNHAFCCECLVKYLNSIDNPKVKCMIPQCNGVIPENIVTECITDDQIKAFKQLSVSGGSQNITKCLIESCPFYIEIGDGITKFECDYCGAQNCMKCHLIHGINDCGRHNVDDITIKAQARQTLKEKRRKDFEELKKTSALIPNPSSFHCSICDEFFLPRTGVILRNCLHCFCMDCLKKTILAKGFISQRRCPYEGCSSELDDGELDALDPDGHSDMVEREAFCRFFRCRDADCTGMWDATERIGTYKCPKCSKINCLECQNIHDGMTCEEFRNTTRYYQSIEDREEVDVCLDVIVNKMRHVKCNICLREFIHNGVSSAIYCNGCGVQTCIFTGKISGCHNPKRCRCKGAPNCTKQGQYCGCTIQVPCDPLCEYGCVK